MKLTIKYLFLSSIFMLSINYSSYGQIIKAKKGYSEQIGTTITMLEDLKRRVTNSVANLSQEETDFLLDEEAVSYTHLTLPTTPYV